MGANDFKVGSEYERFSFYETFYNCIQALPQEEQLDAYEVVVEYGLFGTYPSEDRPISSRVIFQAVKGQIEHQKNRYNDSKKGGRKKAAAEQPAIEQHDEPIDEVQRILDDPKISDSEKQQRIKRYEHAHGVQMIDDFTKGLYKGV